VARSKFQNSEKYFSKSENHQKIFLQNRKKIRNSSFSQTSGCCVKILAFIFLLGRCSLIYALFSEVIRQKEAKSNGHIVSLTQKLLKEVSIQVIHRIPNLSRKEYKNKS